MVFPINRSDITEIVCDQVFRKKKGGKLYRCSRTAERIWSLTSMQPDKYWAGQIVHGKYVTKKSEISKDIEPVTKNTKDYVNKRFKQHVKERKEKHDTELHSLLQNEIRHFNIHSENKETRKKIEREQYAYQSERSNGATE